ncbi:MAG: transposase [Candidatus Omnitrophota bacterium]
MPRLPRIHIEGGLYFVVTRGDHDNYLFKDDADYEQYLSLLLKYKEQHGFKLFAYILTPKAVYLLMEIAHNTIISDVMHVITSTYTKYFNSRYQRKGHVFGGRYSAAVVEKERYLHLMTRYIHNIAVKEQLSVRVEDYKWSSYSLYMVPKGDSKEVLARFSTVPEEQIKLYQRFTRKSTYKETEDIRKQVIRPGIIGSKRFVERIKQELDGKIKKEIRIKNSFTRIVYAHRLLIIAGTIAILCLSVFTCYSYMMNKKAVNKVKRLVQENEETIKKDLEEKYRDDMVSYYHAMVKRLEHERKRMEK